MSWMVLREVVSFPSFTRLVNEEIPLLGHKKGACGGDRTRLRLRLEMVYFFSSASFFSAAFFFRS
jgi:hypothetical protein